MNMRSSVRSCLAVLGIVGMALPLLWTSAEALDERPATVEGLLLAILEANAKGECPEALMAAALKAECAQNLPSFGPILKRLGRIQGSRFEGTETLVSGPADVYSVTFAHGDMSFVVNTLDDGRAMNMIAPDPPRWHDRTGSEPESAGH